MNRFGSLLFFHSLFLFPAVLPAQEEENSFALDPFIKDIYILPSFLYQSASTGSLHDFNALMPGSNILRTDLRGYEQTTGPSGIITSSLAISAGLDFKNMAAQPKTSRQLRLGIVYNNRIALSSNYSKEERERSDTLYQGGQVLYIDSVRRKTVSLHHVSQELRLDVSMIFRTPCASRWTMYGGLGMDAGFSLRAFSLGQADEALTMESSGQDTQESAVHRRSSEHYANRTNYGFCAYLPIGLDVRLGNKKPLLKQLHLFLETRPGVNVSVVPETGTLVAPDIKAGGGIRMSMY